MTVLHFVIGLLELPAALDTWTLVVWSGRLVGALLIPSVLLQSSTRPFEAVTWILVLLFIPFLGAALWLLFGRNYLQRQTAGRLRSHRSAARGFAPPESPPPSGKQPAGPAEILMESSAETDRRHDVFPTTTGNAVRLYDPPAVAYDAFAEAIESATDHVHFQYYTWNDDPTGRRFRDLLAERADDGLEVRVLYDAVGSVGLGRRFTGPIAEAGGDAEPFMPVKPWQRRLRANFRNHRKLLIVDGRTAFTGGVNIAEEYRDWFDTAYGFSGPVVDQMQAVFAEDWHFTTGEKLGADRYFSADQPVGLPEPEESDSDSIDRDAAARIVASGPDDPFDNNREMFFLALTSARSRIDIATPYLLPDTAISTALETAALRGVDVRIIVPAQSDVPFTQHASRTFWEPLLRAGVRLFRYRSRIHHAKLMIIDDTHVVLGSSNMDTRSFHLNFEADALVEHPGFNRRLSGLFSDALDESEEVELESFVERPYKTRLLEGVARLFTPVM